MENQEKNGYEERPGSISIFTNKKIGDNITHNFYGNLISLEGEERKIQLYTRDSKDKKAFLTGNVGVSYQVLNEMPTNINSDQANSITLFLNDKYVEKETLEDGEKEKPYYTGFYIDSLSNKLQVALWKKKSKINSVDFFSGKISESTTS